ncbi:MAG: hypothetical protein LBI42_07925 [Chitinispirillales bacterium]|jgi:hypothetical protein|nr:hypothetical protein [Chitinispirillales bacterium]
MIIANPIYDATFKRLLENDRAAKFFIGTILNCKVLSLEPTVREHTEYDDKTGKLTLFRMDFAATIQTGNEGEKRVIIELQKAKHLGDVYRFRKYPGKEYVRSKLPIISIYILGFNLSVESPAFGNVPVYRDLRTNEELHFYDSFVEQLTHSAYFVQAKRIKRSPDSKLDKLLSVFEQDNFVGDDRTTKNYPLEVDDPEIKTVIDVLRHVAADPKAREELDREEYYQEAMDEMFGEKDRELVQTKLKYEDAIQREEEANKTIERQNHELAETRQREEEANNRQKTSIKNLIDKGFSPEEVSHLLNIPIQLIQ